MFNYDRNQLYYELQSILIKTYVKGMLAITETSEVRPEF